jgi:alpha-tubulin suppressor-like RCC1 family protein
MSVTISGGGVTISGGGWTLSPPPLGFLLYSIGGYNSQGQLGLNDTIDRSSPVQVGTTNNWDKIDTNYYISIATRKDGTMWTWGNASWGVLGHNNNSVSKSSPTQVGALTTWLNVNAGTDFTLATKTDGTLWAWGRNNYYMLGLGSDSEPRSSPTQVGVGTTWLNVTAGYTHALATTTDGKLYSWGRNYWGELGLNVQGGYKSLPTQVGALTNWVNVISKHQSTYAIKSDGTLWAWGKNSAGQLGVGDSITRSSPVQVGALNTWLNVSAGEYGGAVATQTNGKLFTWGYNSGGSMGGNGSSNSPIQLGTDTNWSQVAYNFDTVAATKTTGTLWTWGYNNKGQLGQNNKVYRSSPTQVGTGTGWLKVSVSNKYNIIGISGDPLS